jgi:hypothetical protein
MIVAGMSSLSLPSSLQMRRSRRCMIPIRTKSASKGIAGYGHLNLGGGRCGPSLDRHQSRSAFPGVLPYPPRYRCSGCPTPSISNESLAPCLDTCRESCVDQRSMMSKRLRAPAATAPSTSPHVGPGTTGTLAPRRPAASDGPGLVQGNHTPRTLSTSILHDGGKLPPTASQWTTALSCCT